jgi:serine/threonine protein kinase
VSALGSIDDHIAHGFTHAEAEALEAVVRGYAIRQFPLLYADQCGLSHREVKPSNILLTDPGNGTETADLPDGQDEFRRSMAQARVGKMP